MISRNINNNRLFYKYEHYFDITIAFSGLESPVVTYVFMFILKKGIAKNIFSVIFKLAAIKVFAKLPTLVVGIINI